MNDIPYVTEILITALSAYLVNNISFSESRYREGKKYNTRYELVLRLFLLSLRISTTVGRVCRERNEADDIVQRAYFSFSFVLLLPKKEDTLYFYTRDYSGVREKKSEKER